MRGHRVALVWLSVAGVVVLVAFLILLWASTEPAWAPWSAPAVETAAVWIALLGVCATVIAIVAAYVELRTLFPRQELDARVQRKLVPDYDLDFSRVIFSNKPESALINAYRLEVWLEDARGAKLSHYGPNPPGSAEWERAPSDEMNFHLLHWVFLRDEPFFPGTEVEAPLVPVSADQATWRAIWHTDRATSDGTLSLEVPPDPE